MSAEERHGPAGPSPEAARVVEPEPPGVALPPTPPGPAAPGSRAPDAGHRAERMLPGGSEWTFDLIARYDREIARIAAHYGLDTYPNQIEVITAESSAPGERHAHLAAFVGEIAARGWRGEPANPRTTVGGIDWIRAQRWTAFQKNTFVTPPFAGFVSGHSTFSRAAAEVMTLFTGDPFFPDGLGEFVAPADRYLPPEKGPTQPTALQWATYYDAADQAGLSRIWSGIHVRADDIPGRVIGSVVGIAAYQKALAYFDGTAVP